jgi:hypothetical protein
MLSISVPSAARARRCRCLACPGPAAATMTSPHGLPRYVGSFLRHMEPYRDYLKWNITEGSHKITLTLSWNFHKHKNRGYKEKLISKLQRTLKLAHSPDSVPKDLSSFLDASSPRKEVRRQSSATLSSPFRRPLSGMSSPFRQRAFSWGRTSRSASFRENTALSSSNGRGGNGGGGSSPMRSMQISPSRYSWPGCAVPLNMDSMTPGEQQSADNLLAAGSNCSTPSPTRRGLHHSRVKLTYRTEEELEASMENLMERTRRETKAKIEAIRREWNNTIKNWNKFFRNGPGGKGGKMLDSSTDTDELPDPSQLVAKCLTSCDKILGSDQVDSGGGGVSR